MSGIANTGQAQVWNGSVGTHWSDHHRHYDAMLAGLNDALFAGAAVAPGDRVLDVGCGAGATTRIAARLAAPGHAVGVDISAPLVRRARALTAAEGVANAAYEQADAQVHRFPPAGYDVVISRGGVMFFADHTAAFGNLARALRPGGRLAFVCPRPAGPDSEEKRVSGRVAGLLGAPDAEVAVAQAAMTSLCEPARVRQALRDYEDVTIAPVTVETVWGRDAADAAGFLLSRAPGRTVPAGTRAAVADTLRPYETATGVRLSSGVWLVTAARPK